LIAAAGAIAQCDCTICPPTAIKPGESGAQQRERPARRPLLCLPIRNALQVAAGDTPRIAFALLTDTQRPLRIGKQSKVPGASSPPRAAEGDAYQ